MTTPSRDLDAAIAIALGWIWEEHPTEDVAYFRPADRFAYGAMCKKDRGDLAYTSALPHYSTDISAAWTLVEELGPSHSFYLRYNCDTPFKGEEYAAVFHLMDDVKAYASTAPHAICLAFLKATDIPSHPPHVEAATHPRF